MGAGAHTSNPHDAYWKSQTPETSKDGVQAVTSVLVNLMKIIVTL